MSNLGSKLSRWAKKLSVPLNWKIAAADPQVPELLRENRWIGMIYVDLVDFELTEQIYGTAYCRQVLSILDELVKERVAGFLAPYRPLGIRRQGDDLVIYFYSSDSPPPSGPTFSQTAEQFRERLGAELSARCSHLIPTGFTFHVGHSLIQPDQDARENPERALYKAYKEAMLAAKNQLDALEMERRREFADLLVNEAIHMVFQPILRMGSGQIMGYEALCRGPSHSFFASPLNLFAYAEKTNHLYALERITRTKALAAMGELSGSLLFLNITPTTVHDPAFRPDEIQAYLQYMGTTPDRVVFEITERTGIEDFRRFRQSLEHYRQYGFKIALDDAGSGYSSLQAVAELQPDFLKIDQSLVRDIHQSATKRILVETFLTFGEKTGGQIIAEGIETAAELSTLQELGVPFGQGFFLAYPAYPPPGVGVAAARLIKDNETRPVRDRNSRLGRIVPVGGISQSVATMNIHTVTKDVVDFFTQHPQVEGIAVLGDDQRPGGLTMRDKLFNQLGTQFGFAVYTERPIYLVMDPQPLIVETDTPVEVVSQLAMARPDHKVYDSIIVTKNGIYHGLVSVRQLLDAITGIQVEAARFANPLTGLPGNRLIEDELLSRLGGGQAFSVIYTDLDHFKGFNDRYGFERGDQAIKLTASILTGEVGRLGHPDDLVGHIGGDDFIVVTRPELSEAICRSVIKTFDARVPELYDPEDRERGYIDSRDRQDRPVRLPVMSVSLALIDCQPGQYQSPEELARIAAELKKYAKAKDGSVFVKERRQRPM